jgi:hypothetical protein
VASAAGANWDGVKADGTLTVTGTDTITKAAQVAVMSPVMTAAGAATVTSAANLYVENAPSAGGSITLTNAYALWVDDGATRLDGTLSVDGATDLDTVAFDSTATVASAGGADWNGFAVGGTCTVTGTTGTDKLSGANYAQPTITSADGGVTITDAATVRIADAPLAAGTATLTNTYALWVDGGKTRLDGILSVDGATDLDTVDVDTSATVASAAGANWDGVKADGTLTVTGTDTITKAAQVAIMSPVMTAAGAATVTSAANLYVEAAPSSGGAITLTSAYAIWSDGGLNRFDGDGTNVFEVPGTAANGQNVTWGNTGPGTFGGGLANTHWLPVKVGAATLYIPMFTGTP